MTINKPYALFVLLFLLTGCGATRTGYTVFLKEDTSRYYNLSGEPCIQSGFQLQKNGHTLITYYSNCAFHTQRELKDYEIPQWNPKPKGSIGIQ